jgi:hypothetical protein
MREQPKIRTYIIYRILYDLSKVAKGWLKPFFVDLEKRLERVDRNDFHYFAAFGTQEWVSLEDHSDQACPGSSARRGGCGGSICVMFRARVRGLRQIFLKQSLTCSIGVGPIKPCEVLAMVWDLLTNGMNPIEDIEVYNG